MKVRDISLTLCSRHTNLWTKL